MIPIVEYSIVLLLGLGAWILGRIRPQILAPLGDLVARIMHHRNTRIALVVIWWWFGWHFFTV